MTILPVILIWQPRGILYAGWVSPVPALNQRMDSGCGWRHQAQGRLK